MRKNIKSCPEFEAVHISINSSSTMVACNMMTWHSENEMNCHSTWFTIDRKHLPHDPKTYALSNKSAARALLLFVDSCCIKFFFCFCSLRSTSRGTFNSPDFFLHPACDPMLPTPSLLSISILFHSQLLYLRKKKMNFIRWWLLSSFTLQILLVCAR